MNFLIQFSIFNRIISSKNWLIFYVSVGRVHPVFFVACTQLHKLSCPCTRYPMCTWYVRTRPRAHRGPQPQRKRREREKGEKEKFEFDIQLNFAITDLKGLTVSFRYCRNPLLPKCLSSLKKKLSFVSERETQ